MNTWIALLRGVNVSGHHKLPMKDLVKVMEKAGFKEVKTYIQSGNLVYKSDEKRPEDLVNLIDTHFGFKPAVFIMNKMDLEAAASNNPYTADQGKMIHFFFLDQTPEKPDFELLNSVKSPTEDFRLIENVFYLYAPDGIGRSKLAEKVGRALKGCSMTARNLNTIEKLLVMAD